MNTSDYALAQKYAHAFINVFIDKLNDQKIDHIKQLVVFLEQHKHVLFYVQLSSIDEEQTKTAFLGLLKDFDFDSLFESLIDMLMEQQRLSLLPKILRYIVQFYYNHYGIMEFTILSSHPLSESELEDIVTFLAKKTSKKIIYTTRIDKDLIAGVKLYSDSYGWEHSIRKHLRALEATA
jgi:ATP synthase F1 delta subunit